MPKTLPLTLFFYLVMRVMKFACRVTPFGEKKAQVWKFRVKDVGRIQWVVVKTKDVFTIRNYWITWTVMPTHHQQKSVAVWARCAMLITVTIST